MQCAIRDEERSVASVYYDADCRFCINAARRFERLLARRRFELVPLQIPGASAKLGIPDDQLLAEMRLLLRDGRVFGGAAAVVEIARRIWWAWPFYAVFSLPGFNWLIHTGYRWFARNRYRVSHACRLDIARETRRGRMSRH